MGFFDDLDQQQAAAAKPAATGGSGFFDDLDQKNATVPSLSADDPRNNAAARAAVSPFIGFNRALKSTLAAPGDITGWALSKATGDDKYRGAGTRAMGTLMMEADPDKGDWKKPVGLLERGLQAAGEGVGSAVIPEAAVGTAARAGAATLYPKVMDALSTMFGSGKSVASSAANATIGAAGGVGGEAGDELFGATGRVAGSLVGGVGAGLGMPTTAALARGAGELAKPVLAKWGVMDAEKQAGKKLLERSGVTRNHLVDAIDNEPGEIVPGSRPTLGQQTGNMGLLAEEKLAGTQAPERFAAREAEQNAARVDALESIQPTGNTGDLPKALQGAMKVIDDHAEQTLQQATQQAQQAAGALPRGGSAEEVGAVVRGHLQDALAQAKEAAGKLWDAVDPQGKLTVAMDPFRAAVAKIYGNLPQATQAMLGPEEKTLIGLVEGYGKVEPLKEFTALRSAITDAMMTERAANNGVATTGYRRLVELRKAADGALNASVEGQVAADRAAVARGEMAPADTMEASLQRQVDAWRKQRQSGLGEGAGASDALPDASRTGAVPAGLRGEVSPNEGAGLPRSDQAIPGPTGEAAVAGGADGSPAASSAGTGSVGPTFDAAARERLNAATAATRQQHETFDRGSVGQVLATRGTANDFRLSDAAVPGRVWRAGSAGKETAQSYLAASGGGAEARDALHDAAMSSLQDARRGIVQADGSINPTKLEAWRKTHASALEAVPELDRALSSASRAAQAVESANAARVAAAKDFQQGAVGKVMGLDDPADIAKTVGGIFGSKNAVSQMERLAREASSQPGGAEGLRRAIAEHMQTVLTGNTEAGTTGVAKLKADQFQTWIRKNVPTLKAAGFSDEQVGSLQAIAADLQRANRSNAAVRTGGGSDTAHKIGPALQKVLNHPTSLLTEMFVGWTGGHHLFGVTGGVLGAGAGVARHLGLAARRAGLEKIDDLVTQALLDPEVARRLLMKVPDKAPRQQMVTASSGLYRALTQSTLRMAGPSATAQAQ